MKVLTKEQAMEYFVKSKTALRYWLIGRGYIKAVEAMDFALEYHKGLRKDKVTPEFQHQVSIAHFLRVFEPLLIYPEDTFATVSLHDVMEDYGVSKEEITENFGERVSRATYKLSKKYREEKKDIEVYYKKIAKCPIASIVKGGDRVHNIHKMVGVFSHKGEVHYVEETEDMILPMLHKARHTFHQQEPAYENIKQVLMAAVEFVKVIHEKELLNKENL